MDARRVAPAPVRVMPTPLVLVTWRCPNCGTILAKLHLEKGSVVAIKCRRCNCYAERCAA